MSSQYKGRTEYHFPLLNSLEYTNQIIQNFLSANKFKQLQAPDGNIYYEINDIMTGRYGFMYTLNAQGLHLWVWINKYNNPYKIERDDFVGDINVNMSIYRNMLNPLFDTLNNQNSQQIQHSNYTPNQDFQNNLNTDFTESVNEKNEKMAVIGFVVSLIGLLLSFFGVTWGGIIILFEYYFASVGLKTKKKGLAIATIVLASLSVLILIFNIIVSMLSF